MAFTSLLKIRFDDVDGAGIVYYPHFFHLCHNAFEDFFDDAASVSYPQLINEKRRGFPTVAIHSDFSAPLRYGDIALVKIEIEKIGRSSVTFNYEIRRKQDSKLCFSAQITKVFMDLDAKIVLPIPQDMRSLLENIL
jgi:YbgC/YbaW family acyl-CoA thioester hydrolase